MNMTDKQMNEELERLAKDLDFKMESDKLPTANIMVAGITGTGKSTLINAVFGEKMAATGSGKPVTKQIDEYGDGDVPIRIWDTVGLELDSEKTKESIKAIKKTIASKSSSKDQYDRIHAIWYCINSGSNRYQGAELEFIKELHSINVPFIIVMTQCSGDENEVNAFETEIKKINTSMGMGDVRIVQVLARSVKYRGMPMPIPEFGLDTLVDVTLELLPTFIKSGFIAAQKVSQSEKRSMSEDIICLYVRAAQNGFWDKVALINTLVTNDKIINMFKKLTEIYITDIPRNSIEEITRNISLNFTNVFFGLISPIDMGYSKRITALLEQRQKEGFKVEVADVEKNYRAARMIAFYGYIFIDSIEVLWKRLTADQLRDVEQVVKELTEIINQKLRERKSKIEG